MAQRREGHAGRSAAGGVGRRVVGRRDHAQPDTRRLEHDGRVGGLGRGAGADRRDARRREVLERVEQRDGPVVEGVVVGQRDAVDPRARQPLGRRRRRAEEERLVRIREALAARRDAALEVDDEQVGAGRRLDDRLIE